VDPRLDQKYPCADDIERKALKRMPRFIRDYIACGMGKGAAVRRNRDELDKVMLCPRYLVDADQVSCEATLFGQPYDAPFGVAPVGMGGIAWPKAAESIAAAARKHNIPFNASTYTTTTLEKLHSQAGPCGWFQYYHPSDSDVADDLLNRAQTAGYDVLMVTVDIPFETRRDHDIRNGFAIPPRFGLSMLVDFATHPAWSLSMAMSGIPTFENFTPYVPKGLNPLQTVEYLNNFVVGHITPEILKGIRDKWPGKLVVKGILSPEDAILSKKIGADGIVISNHGGRQLEASPTSTQMLPTIRTAVGADYPLIADGGVRTGMDICRMLALGADFVMMGRPFYYAVAAMGAKGADHMIQIFMEELRCTMGQLGCNSIAELSDRLMDG
jgi:isopentenyl diphosphate isomerase/L-lactate dehydrogenase-like FMN-dependent dehydrogenase